MSSVPEAPPHTIKKVAATSGHRVRRTNVFLAIGFRLGMVASGWGFSVWWRGALAVGNFDVFLLKRLTLSYSAAGWSSFEIVFESVLELSGLFRFQKFRWS